MHNATSRHRRRCRVYSVEDRQVPYAEAWAWQQSLLRQRMAWQRQRGGDSPHYGCDALILLEHPSVYTLGRGSTTENLKFDPAAPGCPHELYRIERGGEVTWHGPGQIVGYPILDLNFHTKDLHWYLRSLEEMIMRVLARRGVQGERDPGNTGVWVGNRKYAAIGLNASRWVTSHGFALNVCPDLSAFDNIVPCGISDKSVGCLADDDPTVTVTDVRAQVM
ncbi:Lipoate-protein ligase B [Tribonema minus]|uniref:lipoyl(octanoyl) transferase n=1 Tax=Tribonema minus TaxID=303371 RepID=A0A835YUM8_9STRA|nr:Lipoate-protein ligase B [Tribonema minus]